MNDPNWLYSTIAQSSASIVGIVGGFIIATVLSKAAERESLSKQLEDKRHRWRELEESHTDMSAGSQRELKREIEDLEERLKAFSYPPNLTRALLTLGFLTVSGIVLPAMIMTLELFFNIIKVAVFILFSLGLGAVFLFFGFQIRDLRKQ